MNEETLINTTLLAEKGVIKMAKPNLGEKDILNPEEAIRYWNFSRRKFYMFLEKTDGGDYLAYYKKRTLIIRLAFEQYLLKNPKVKEGLANGRSRKRED